MICKQNSITGIDLFYHTHSEDFEPSQLKMQEMLVKLSTHYDATTVCHKTKILSGHVIKSKPDQTTGHMNHTIVLSKNDQFRIFAFPTQDSKIAPYSKNSKSKCDMHSCKQ